MTTALPEIFTTHDMKAAYIGEFKFSLARDGARLWVTHRFVREFNKFGTESGKFLGTIIPDGGYRPAQGSGPYVQRVKDVILAVGEEGIEFIIRNGKELGECTFCGRRLEDPESVIRGYGPVCKVNHRL
ncbi:MAG: hypothetical protein KGI54_13155 [Pseudomonadota bacterium]|nr:hypothetical protein [Pseudomonadota bacterium]